MVDVVFVVVELIDVWVGLVVVFVVGVGVVELLFGIGVDDVVVK